jgi:hypothetical protein
MPWLVGLVSVAAAAVSAAATATSATSAVAAATASAAATPAVAAATASAAATPAVATAATTTAAAATFLTGTGFVYGECAATVLLPVEGGDGGVGFGVVRHLDEPEALAAAGVPVVDDLGGYNLPVLRKQLL